MPWPFINGVYHEDISRKGASLMCKVWCVFVEVPGTTTRRAMAVTLIQGANRSNEGVEEDAEEDEEEDEEVEVDVADDSESVDVEVPVVLLGGGGG